jgi:serine/threonine protein kinase
MGLDTDAKKKVAVKIMNSKMDTETRKLVMTEVYALSQLAGHPNILQIIEQGDGKYESKGKSKDVSYIVLELAAGGELFDFIANYGAFDESLARYFFKQFMDGLSHIHNQGFTHRDLKPENLMLDSKFTLKIADFGFAGPSEGNNGTGMCTTILGT